MPGEGRVERLVSAGGVVYRRDDGQVLVVLCGRIAPIMWALPKGTPSPGESLGRTALREVQEETGLEVELEEELGKVQYWFVRSQDGVRCFKTVHFYLMHSVGGSLDKHDPEFDLVQWFPIQEALHKMTYASEAEMVKKVLERLNGGNHR